MEAFAGALFEMDDAIEVEVPGGAGLVGDERRPQAEGGELATAAMTTTAKAAIGPRSGGAGTGTITMPDGGKLSVTGVS